MTVLIALRHLVKLNMIKWGKKLVEFNKLSNNKKQLIWTTTSIEVIKNENIYHTEPPDKLLSSDQQLDDEHYVQESEIVNSYDNNDSDDKNIKKWPDLDL